MGRKVRKFKIDKADAAEGGKHWPKGRRLRIKTANRSSAGRTVRYSTAIERIRNGQG